PMHNASRLRHTVAELVDLTREVGPDGRLPVWSGSWTVAGTVTRRTSSLREGSRASDLRMFVLNCLRSTFASFASVIAPVPFRTARDCSGLTGFMVRS